MTMLRAISIRSAAALLLLLIPPSASHAGQEAEEVAIGKRIPLHSDVLSEDREIEVYLPDGYAETDESYPVLVVLDGEWMFRYCVSVVDMISPHHLPKMIIVGLPNTDRNRDLKPLGQDPSDPEAGPRTFLRFIEQELMPHIEEQYRALPYRVIMGHSLAGLFAIYTLATNPDLFTAYIATSPSIWAAEPKELLIDRLQTSAAKMPPGRYLYMSVGGNEPEALHERLRELHGTIKAIREGKLEYAFDTFEGEGHVPILGFYRALRGLFPEWYPGSGLILGGTLDDLRRHYDRLTNEYGFPVSAPPAIINSMGRRFLREENGRDAGDAYRYYISMFPRSAPAHLGLAEACVMTGETDRAIEALEKALEIDPGNTRAGEMLGEIRGSSGR